MRVLSFALRGDVSPAIGRLVGDRIRLETFEPSDVDDEDNRAANFDFEVFRHVEQTRLQGGRVWDRDLGPAAARASQDPKHRLNLIVFDADQETGVAST